MDAVAALDSHTFTTFERFEALERCERVRRRLPSLEHGMINQIAREATAEELGGKLSHALAEWVLISRGEAARRIHEARDLGPRTALNGEPLQPALPSTAAAQRVGRLGPGQVAVIRRFCHQLPGWIDEPTREHAEAKLAGLGTRYRPEQLSRLAEKLADCLNPDGNFTDEDRARMRQLTLGKQEVDGMSTLHARLTPEARAALEAVLARLAAPGMCNAADESPCVDGTASEQAIQNDSRSAAQRNHDALHAALRAVLASGKLGQHNGLPASIIVTTTLQELEAGCGKGLTGGGSLLPMSDVIRMVSHAHNYLAIFDEGRAIGLYHRKRLASPGQRIVLYAKDRGCSFPGCDVPGYLSEVHHVREWAKCRETHIDDLTFACGPQHQLVKPGGWQTRKRHDGITEWIPPPHLDRGQPRTNAFHHPERLLRDGEDDP
ncbi:MAG: HNH endonuclease [Mycobacterium sp.]|nr:HNH endonuclease [Mycobacterium sp.]